MAIRHVLLAAIVLVAVAWRWPRERRVPPPIVIREGEQEDGNWELYEATKASSVTPEVFRVSWDSDEKFRRQGVFAGSIGLSPEGVVWMFRDTDFSPGDAWAQVYSPAEAERLYDGIVGELERLHASTAWARRMDVTLERWTSRGRTETVYHLPWFGGLESLASGLGRRGESYRDLYGGSFSLSREPEMRSMGKYPILPTQPWIFRRLIPPPHTSDVRTP